MLGLQVSLQASTDAKAILDKAEKILASDPENLSARYNHAWASAVLGKHAEAEKEFSSILARATGDLKTDTLYNLGHTQFMQKKIQAAMETWRAGLRQSPSDQDMRHNYTVARRLLQQEKNTNSNNKDEQQDKKQNKQDGNSSSSPSQQEKQNQNDPQKKDSPDARKQAAAGSMSSEEAMRLLKALQEQEQEANPREKEILGGLRREKDW
jgi:tetratricopeptide (TPR) repeat protein